MEHQRRNAQPQQRAGAVDEDIAHLTAAVGENLQRFVDRAGERAESSGSEKALFSAAFQPEE